MVYGIDVVELFFILVGGIFQQQGARHVFLQDVIWDIGFVSRGIQQHAWLMIESW